MKGCLLPDGILSGVVPNQKEKAINTTDRTAVVAGWDVHRRFSTVTARNACGMAKSNRTDADLLSELGRQTDRWWQVWLPPCEVRDRREWLRYRMTLVRLQTGLKNRIHAILHRHGILHDFSDLFGVAGRGMLTRLAHDPKNPRLSESGRATLKAYLQLLDHLRRQIATVTRTRAFPVSVFHDRALVLCHS